MATKLSLNILPKKPKPTVWLGSSLKDIQKMPEDVQDGIGKALMGAEYGDKDPSAEAFGGGIFEIKFNHDDGNTYRLVYTVEKPLLVYVLHTWTKKSHHKKEMDKSDRVLISTRKSTIQNRYISDVEEKYGVKIEVKSNNVNHP